MQNLSGLLLLATGLAVGVGIWGPKSDQATATLAEVTRISTAPDSDSSVVALVPTGLLPGAPRTSAEATAPSDTPKKKPDVANKPWSTVVAADPAATGSSKLSSPRPSDAMTRAELTRDLQRELTRVGCYGGEINGGWTQSTRRAMAAFVDRANASLPTAEPDYILLSMIRNFTDAACTTSCATGEVMSQVGKCVPQVIADRDDRAAAKRAERQRVAVADAAKRDEDKRVAELNRAANKSLPKPVAPAPPVTAQVTTPAAARVAVAEVLPWQAKPTLAAPAAPAKVAEQPRRPEGIMALGVPVASADASAIAAEPVVPPSNRTVIAAVTPEPDPQSIEREAAAETAEDNALVAPSTIVRRSTEGSNSVAVARPARKAVVRSTYRRPKVRVARAYRRPPTRYVYSRPRSRSYFAQSAYGFGYSKPRRAQPRYASQRFYMMRALGGIY